MRLARLVIIHANAQKMRTCKQKQNKMTVKPKRQMIAINGEENRGREIRGNEHKTLY